MFSLHNRKRQRLDAHNYKFVTRPSSLQIFILQLFFSFSIKGIFNKNYLIRVIIQFFHNYNVISEKIPPKTPPNATAFTLEKSNHT